MRKFTTENGIVGKRFGDNGEKAVVMAGGISSFPEMIEEKVKYFAENGIDAFVYDQPNFGKSDTWTQKYDADYRLQREALKDVVDYVTNQDFKEKFGIGWSYGASSILANAKEVNFDKIIFENGFHNAVGFIKSSPLSVIKNQPKALADFCMNVLGFKPVYLNCIDELFGGDDTFQKMAEENNVEYPNKIRAKELLNCPFNIQPKGTQIYLKSICNRILVVNATQDKIIHPDSVRGFAKSINARILEIYGGHFLSQTSSYVWGKELEFLKN